MKIRFFFVLGAIILINVGVFALLFHFRAEIAYNIKALASGAQGRRDDVSAQAEPKENIDEQERAEVARIEAALDLINRETAKFCERVRDHFESKDFDELENIAQEICSQKAVFGNGSWKIEHFHEALELSGERRDSMWRTYESLHKDWLAAKPQSMTAHVAYAKFYTQYAWKARGSGYIDTVTEEGWRLFKERLTEAKKLLESARNSLEGHDPVLWTVLLTLALGQEWEKEQFEEVVSAARKAEPTFWQVETSRAYSLLPRWYGKPGDWEAFAAEAAMQPNGLGAEAYARIVISLIGFHTNVFRESKASWPKTKEGLALMRQRYPDSMEIVSYSALLATMAYDQKLAKEMFDRLGDYYLGYVWSRPESFVHYRHWARTGQW